MAESRSRLGAVHLRVALAVLACAVAAFGVGAPATRAATASPAAGYPEAVVLVSGVESLTPFTTPSPACAGQEGNAWSPEVAPTLRAAGLAVFTAPVAPNGESNPSCTAGGPEVTPAMEINSDGEVNANGLALARFLSFLAQSYGVQRVQLVAHSDGGLWSRSAITQELALEESSLAVPSIMSMTTIGTPQTGSFVADVGTQASNFPCTEKLRCAAIHAIAKDVFESLGETALYQLSSPFLMTWNPQQQIEGCPITAIAGTADDDTKFFSGASLYYNPSDGLVGEASAFNQGAAALNGSEIPPAPGLNIVTRLTFPDWHTASLGTPDELSDPAVAEAALAAVQVGSTTPCNVAASSPPPSAPSTPPVTVSLEMRTATTTDPSSRLPRPRRGDAIITLGRHPRITCQGRRLISRPVRDRPELRLTIPDRCHNRLVVHRGTAVLLRVVPGVRLAVTIHGARVHVRVDRGHLDHLHAEARTGRAWHHLRLGLRGRGRLPRHAIALRVSGRLEDGELASAVAFVAR
ncbi:MAG TPA: hypothetical protein VGC32_02570 [Solirubrobacterales bacterium]